jgi:hypothetical protein
MNLKWKVVDESSERPGYICLAVREEMSGRLICDLSDYPDDVPCFVERVKGEANIIAQSRELFDMLNRVVDATAKYENVNDCDTLQEARDLIAKIREQ